MVDQQQQTIEEFQRLQSMVDSYKGASGSLNGVQIDPKTGLQQTTGNTLSSLLASMGSIGDAQYSQTARFSDMYADLAAQLRGGAGDQELGDATAQLAQYGPEQQKIIQEMMGVSREGDLGDVSRLAGLVREGDIAGTDPRVRALRDTMIGRAGDELAMGGDMSADQQRRANESIRSGLGARGISQGVTGAGRESLQNMIQGEGLKNQRQGFAQSVIDSESAKQKDPFSIILGNPNTSANYASTNYKNPAFMPNLAGMPDFFGQAFNTGQLAQNQQQIETDARNKQLALGLGLGTANDVGAITNNLNTLI